MAEKKSNQEKHKRRRELDLAVFLFQVCHQGNYQDLQDVLSSDKIKSERKWLVLINAKAANGMPILIYCLHGSAQKEDEKDYLECIKVLLSTGIPLDSKDADGRTAIHWAVLLGKIEICRYLLQHRASIEGGKLSPLHVAINKRSVQFVKLLCEYKTEHMLTEKDDLGRSPLCHALLIENSLEVFKELLSAGCDVNGCMTNGKSLLAHVIENDMVEFLEEMLKFDVNVFPHGNDHFSLIHLSAIQKSSRCLKVFAQSSVVSSMDCPDQNGKSPLIYAVENELVENVQILIEKQVNVRMVDVDGNTALHFASRKSSTEVIDLLLEKDKTLLHICNNIQRYPINNAVITNNQMIVRALLDHGASTDVVDSEGHTLVHYAAQFSSSACLAELASVGLSLNVPDLHGVYPIHYAVRLDPGEVNTTNNKVDFLKKLVASGVDLNVSDDRGLKPIHWSVCTGFTEALKVLLIEDADFNAKTDDEKFTAIHLACSCNQFECLKLLLCQPAIDIDQPDFQGKTPLFTACNLQDPGFTEALLNAGANPDHQDKEGKTPAHIAAANTTVDCLWLLSLKKANFEIGNNSQETPLHLACKNPDDACIRFLLTRRCNVNTSQKDGITALHIAVTNKYSSKVDLLLQNGAKHNQIFYGENDAFTPLDIALNNADYKCIKLLQQFGARTAHYIRTQAANIIRVTWKGYRKRKVARGEALPLANSSSIYTSSNASESVSVKGANIVEERSLKQLDDTINEMDSSEILTLKGRSVASTSQEVTMNHHNNEHCQNFVEIPDYMMNVLTEKYRRDFAERMNRSDREILLMRDLMKETEQLLVRAKRVNEEAESIANSESFRRIKKANKEYMASQASGKHFSIARPNFSNS